MHEFIRESLWTIYHSTRYGKVADAPNTKDNQFFTEIFTNYRRTKSPHIGLRLSFLGETLMRKTFKAYKYPLEDHPSNHSLILLDPNMQWPYYLGKKYVTFFNEVDASWFQLTGKNIKQFAEDL